MTLAVRPAVPADAPQWLALRHALWPDQPLAELEPDLANYLGQPETHLALVAESPAGRCIGFAEVRLRNFAEECYTSPVAYLEAWYVTPDFRRQGVGRRLVEAAADWARTRGCRDFGSDTSVENLVSRAAHRALGFEEGTPVVHFRRAIAPRQEADGNAPARRAGR